MADFKMRTTRVALTDTDTQDITISGFGTCKGALIFVNAAETNATVTAGDLLSIGCIDDAGNYGVVAHFAADSVSTMVTKRRTSSGLCVQTLKQSGTSEFQAIGAFITDGIRLTWTSVNNPSTPYLCTVVLFGGEDFEMDLLFIQGASSANTEQIITGARFRPQARIILGVHYQSINVTDNDVQNSICFLSSSGSEVKEAGISYFSDHNLSTSVNSMNMHPGAMSQLLTASLNGTTKSQQNNSAGWVEKPDFSNDDWSMHIAFRINGGSIDTKTFLTPINTVDLHNVEYANEPEACLYLATHAVNPLRDGLHVGNVYNIGIGVCDQLGNSFTLTNANRDNVSTSECHSQVTTDAIRSVNHAGSTAQVWRHEAYHGNSHVLDIVNSDGQARPFVGMSFSSGQNKKQPRLQRL